MRSSPRSTGALPDFDSLWDFDHPGLSEMEFAKLMPAARSSANIDYLAQLLTQLARSQGLQMRFDEAHQALDEAESLLTPDLEVARVRLLLERGRVLNSSGKREEARPIFLRAWDLAREAHADGFAVDAAHMVAIVEAGDEAIEWNRKALALAESSQDPRARRWLGSLYNNLGWTYHGRGEYTIALDLFGKALAARVVAGKAREIRIAQWCVGRALRSLGRLEEALAIQRELDAEWSSIGKTDGYVLEELAECLLALQRPDEARPYFADAHHELAKEAWLVQDEPARLERLKQLGDAPR